MSEYTLYKRRWLYLLVVCLLNFSNATVWICFSPITFYTNDYYGFSNAALFFNTVFMVLSIPVGFVACYCTDRFGLKSGCLLGAWLNFCGMVLRVIGSASFMDKGMRFPVSFAGQILAAAAQPFVMFLPTKLTGFWFPDDQRNIANTLASMSNPIGIAVMYSVAPLFVNDDKPDNFFFMNICLGILAAVTALFSLLITRSEPPTPASAARTDQGPAAPPFLQGVKACFTNRSFLVLAMGLGGGVGLFNALYNNLQPALCVKGYSATFSGLMGSLLIVSGLIGAAVSGVIVDKTKRFEEVMKICFSAAGLFACSLAMSINFEHQQGWIAASIALFGAFGFAIYPIGLEMGVEATYPVAEATSTGLLIMIGQIEGVIFVVLTNLVNGVANAHDLAIQTCVSRVADVGTVVTWKWPFIMWNVCVIVCITVFVSCFWPVYKRQAYEESNKLPDVFDSRQQLSVRDVEKEDYAL